jgi:hypothetical protein
MQMALIDREAGIDVLTPAERLQFEQHGCVAVSGALDDDLLWRTHPPFT